MGTRAYRSERREADAAATRAAIRDAASRLFVAQGYAATTLRDVAREAGVGERTVYAAFASKFDLYHHALDVATVGDEEPVPVRDRPEVAAALEVPDPRASLAAGIDYGVALFERAGDLIWVGIQAEGADPQVRALAEGGSRETRAVMLRTAVDLAERRALRPGLGAHEAADVLFSLSSPHVFHLLRRVCGWTAQAYRAWLQRTLADQLLGE